MPWHSWEQFHGVCIVLLSKRAGHATGGGALIPFFQLTLGLAFPLSFMNGATAWGNLTHWWLAFLAVFCVMQFIAYLSWDYGMRMGNIVVLSLCADFIPWLSLIACHFLLRVKIENTTIVAMILLVMGAMIARYGTQQKKIALMQEERPVP